MERDWILFQTIINPLFKQNLNPKAIILRSLNNLFAMYYDLWSHFLERFRFISHSNFIDFYISVSFSLIFHYFFLFYFVLSQLSSIGLPFAQFNQTAAVAAAAAAAAAFPSTPLMLPIDQRTHEGM